MVAVILLAAVAGAFVTAGLVLAFGGGKSGSSASTKAPNASTAPTSTRPPTVAGQELIKLIASGRNQTFHAQYLATSTDPTSAASSHRVTLDLWRKPPMEREELAQTSGGAVVRTAGLLLPPKSVLCRQADGVTWTCANTPQTQADDLLNGVTGDVASQASDVRDDTVASTPVRCFQVPDAGAQTSELCLTAQGITARLTSGASKIELVNLSFDVPDSVFVPPATPTG